MALLSASLPNMAVDFSRSDSIHVRQFPLVLNRSSGDYMSTLTTCFVEPYCFLYVLLLFDISRLTSHLGGRISSHHS